MTEQPQFDLILEQPFQQALEEVENALKKLGFTIITRIDVQHMMRDQMDIEFHPYVILGACDTPIASRALEIDPSIGLMLPCNVSVETRPDGFIHIRVADPVESLGCRASENPRLTALAVEAAQRLSEVIALLRSSARPTSPEAKPWDRLTHLHHE
jgi:uncharacterized protein (DUF302 family)